MNDAHRFAEDLLAIPRRPFVREFPMAARACLGPLYSMDWDIVKERMCTPICFSRWEATGIAAIDVDGGAWAYCVDNWWRFAKPELYDWRRVYVWVPLP